MHSYSVKLKGNFQRVKKDNSVALYLQVLINGKKLTVSTDLTWHKDFIDNKNGKILPQGKTDQFYHDYSMIIQDKISKANEIFMLYRLKDKVLTPEAFAIEYKNFDSRKDFLVFMEQDIEWRYTHGEIKERTWLNHKATLHKLQSFKTPILFYEITASLISRFKTYLRKEYKNSDTTIWGNIKDIRTYVDRAKLAGNHVDDDYKADKNPAKGGRIIWLEETELKAIYNYFLDEEINPEIKKSLRPFLFQCFTSLRISDIYKANWHWVNSNNDMVFVPVKLEKFKTEVTVPLTDLALSLIENKRGLFFNMPAEQTINDHLKTVADDCNIKKNLTTHVGRHTFGTLFYRHTKDIISLSRIMGHSKIQTTMIYAHVNDRDKREGALKYESAFNEVLSEKKPG